ncbi:MAG TPA: chaperone modulator CbpM, partial [Chitinophagaceae bacterium]
MDQSQMVVVEEFCIVHEVEVSFVDSLAEHDLVHVVSIDQRSYVSQDELPALERFVRLHQDLGLPADSLDVIDRLLAQITTLQEEIAQL